MTTAALHIVGTKYGGLTGPQPIGPWAINNTNSTDQVSVLSLSGGNNTITVPSSTCVGLVLVPPVNNTVSLTLKGSGSDTGIPLHLTNPTVLSIVAGTSSIIISAGGTVSIELAWF